MEIFFFTYTTFILIVCVAVASICIATLIVTRSKRYIAQALFFICYFFELAEIFGAEWLQQNLQTINASNYYAVDVPVFRILIGACILASFWAIVFEMLDIVSLKTLLIPTFFTIGLQALILVAMPYGPWQQFLFYSVRQLSLLSCLAYAVIKVWRTKDKTLKTRMLTRKKQLLAVLILTICILIEDSVVILINPVPAPGSLFTGLYLSSRNFSENLMMLLLAYIVIRDAIGQLRLFYFEPPTATHTDAKEDKRLRDHIDVRLMPFAKAHGLSDREREILALTLEGYSNKRLASELYLSEGTVKTHLHNIMKKCEVKNRETLKQLFWSS